VTVAFRPLDALVQAGIYPVIVLLLPMQGPVRAPLVHAVAHDADAS
jgi:hypothetical protein